MTMPAQKPGKSVQEVQTPPEFMNAVRNLIGISEFFTDLAASPENAQASAYYTKEMDALTKEWHVLKSGWLWLNPPYADIEPWVQKAFIECVKGAKIAVLVPASVGSNWWADWVDGVCSVYFVKGRVTFVGHKSPYPKDLALLLYRRPDITGYQMWDWKKELTKTP